MQLLNDFQTSVEKALTEIDPNWRAYPGLIIAGSHSPHDTEEYIEHIKAAREMGIPFLGICAGHQLAAIEYARNVLGIKDATSEEFCPYKDLPMEKWNGKGCMCGTYVVKKLPELNVGFKNGESYWNNYEVVLEGWEKPPHFITVQYHPEYQSSITSPHHDLVAFINLCKVM